MNSLSNNSFGCAGTKEMTPKTSLPKPSDPIGLFDSGVGGLSIYQHLRQMLPHEHYIYYADTLNVPYGERSFANIEKLTLDAVAWLVGAGCKLVIVACNSASTHALDSLRERYRHIPIVGLVPALKPAVLASQTGHVAVLATKATLEGKLLNQVITDYAVPHNIAVTKWCDASLVPWVEAGMPVDAQVAINLIAKLDYMADSGVDHVVLGCTHYPFFRPFLQQHIDNNNLGITLIDSGQAIATRVQSLLMNSRLQIGNMSAHLLSYDKPNRITTSQHDDIVGLQTLPNTTDNAAQSPNLQFFSTKGEPQLQSLVRRLINDSQVVFI